MAAAEPLLPVDPPAEPLVLAEPPAGLPLAMPDEPLPAPEVDAEPEPDPDAADFSFG